MPALTIPNLKKLRTERLLSQTQLGEAIGISPRTLIRWEGGQGEPGASELLALARFFGVSIDQLVGDLLPAESTGALPKVADLVGRQLDYWVARAEGLSPEFLESGPVIYVAGEGQQPVAAYCTDWACGEPIMERVGMHLMPIAAGATFDGIPRPKGWIARPAACSGAAWGRSMLEAGMRAHLMAEIGDHILT
jgi:transcriptional regulator with XRE-family HTH domain